MKAPPGRGKSQGLNEFPALRHFLWRAGWSGGLSCFLRRMRCTEAQAQRNLQSLLCCGKAPAHAKAQASARRYCRNSALSICCRWHACRACICLHMRFMRELAGSALALLLLLATQHSLASVGACRGRGRMQEYLQSSRYWPLKCWPSRKLKASCPYELAGLARPLPAMQG